MKAVTAEVYIGIFRSSEREYDLNGQGERGKAVLHPRC
jgi:hypothetical protein